MSASIYLDNHAATKPCLPALERMRPYLEEQWGASFAPHRMGMEQILAMDGRVQMIYDLAGAVEGDRFAFAGGGAEAVQQVLWTAFIELSRKEGKCHFVTTGLEDAPLTMGLKRLEELGCFVKIAPCKAAGHVDVAQLAALINPRTALVSLSWAQGLTGVIQPVDEIAALCKEKGVLLHLDATYAVGKTQLEMKGDYMTFAGDRMHGLKSSGAVFAKAGVPLTPLLVGSGIDVPSLVALSAAASQSILSLDVMGLEGARLRDRLEQRVLEKAAGARVLFGESLRLPNVSVIAFEGVHQEALLYQLNKRRVYASIGGGVHPHLARILMAAGVGERTAASAIHFSLSRMTTEAEVETAAERIGEAYAALRSLSKDLA